MCTIIQVASMPSLCCNIALSQHFKKHRKSIRLIIPLHHIWIIFAEQTIAEENIVKYSFSVQMMSLSDMTCHAFGFPSLIGNEQHQSLPPLHWLSTELVIFFIFHIIILCCLNFFTTLKFIIDCNQSQMSFLLLSFFKKKKKIFDFKCSFLNLPLWQKNVNYY